MTKESKRLQQSDWKKWGPYLSERQWGTVREDYSATGEAWDLAFHCLPIALVDPEFAKYQLDIMTREWYMHPNGQIPAYEWAFGVRQISIFGVLAYAKY